MVTDTTGEIFGMCKEFEPFLLLRFTIFGFFVRVIRFSKDTLMEASSTGAVLVSFKGITHDVRATIIYCMVTFHRLITVCGISCH